MKATYVILYWCLSAGRLVMETRDDQGAARARVAQLRAERDATQILVFEAVADLT